MTDDEFLSYCHSMAETPRAGFVPEHIERVLRLAGEDELADRWRDAPLQIVSIPADEMHPMVERARQRLAARQHDGAA